MRPVLGEACLVGKGRWPAAAVTWDSTPASASIVGRGRDADERLTGDLHSPALTARDRLAPAVPDAVRVDASQAPAFWYESNHSAYLALSGERVREDR